MRRLQIKFPNQIRISGWDFDSSARAMNQAGGKDSLMTYENEPHTQADSRIVRELTFERKIMSTKTSIKRIALVAVAGLGFGMVTTVAANAADVGTWDVALAASKTNSISLAQVTATPTTGAAVSVNFGADVTTTTVTAGDHGQSTSYTGYLSSYPAGGFAQVTAGTAAGTPTPLTGATTVVSGSSTTVKQTVQGTAIGTSVVTASSTVGVSKYSFTPAVAGTYVLSVWNDADADGVVDIGEAVQTINLTVAAAAAANTTPSATYSSIGAWDGTSYSKVAGTFAGAAKTVTIKNTDNANLNGQTIRAVVNGPGTVTLVGSATVTGRDVSNTLAADANTATLRITADGNSGKTTVDVYAGTTKLLTTAAVTFYGTLATLKVTQNKSVVAKNTSLASAVTISGLDAEGIAVPLADTTVVGTSSDTTVLLSTTDTEDSVDAGVLTVAVVGANDLTTTSGRSATITWKYLISGTTYTPSVVSTFTIGGAKNTVKITLDDTNYAPGALVTATITATDASGNASADGTVILANKLTSSVALQGLTTAAIATVGGTATTTFYAPAAGTGFTVTAAYVDAAAADQTATASATISNVAADAVDAANEATDAANAATDAANAAAEAADAATAAAQDAQAAVAALATQVSSLIAGIKAQITSLTNLVIKIQKKVKA